MILDMIVSCNTCKDSTLHVLHPFVAAEDGQIYALAQCFYCKTMVLIACTCQQEMLLRNGVLVCPDCDHGKEMPCLPTLGNTCGSSCDNTEPKEGTEEA